MQQVQQESQWHTLMVNIWKTAGRLTECLICTKNFKEAERVLEASLRRWWWCAASLERDPAPDRSPEAGHVEPEDLACLHQLAYHWGQGTPRSPCAA